MKLKILSGLLKLSLPIFSTGVNGKPAKNELFTLPETERSKFARLWLPVPESANDTPTPVMSIGKNLPIPIELAMPAPLFTLKPPTSTEPLFQIFKSVIVPPRFENAGIVADNDPTEATRLE